MARGAFGALVLGFAAEASAQTAVDWTATSSGNWSTGGNWSGGSKPASSLTTNYASFNQSTGVTVTADTTQSVAGLSFGSSAGSYTISNTGGQGKTLTLGSFGIVNSSANGQTITGSKLTLTLGAASTFTVNGTGNLTISTSNGSIATSATNTLTLRGTGAGIGTISSVISGTGGTVTKLDSGTWVLSGGNTYTGATIIGSANGASGGTLQMGASSILGAGGLTIYGGTFDTTANSYTDNAGTLTLGGGAAGTTASITGSGNLTLGGNLTYDATNNPNGATILASLTLGGNRTFIVGDSTAAATDLSISGTISGANSIIKSGTGVLSLSGNNTYTGTTTISQGTIQVDANAPSGAAGALGNASSAVTLNDAGTGANNTALLIGTSGLTVGRAITVANSGTGTATLGSNLTSGTGTFTSNITLNKAASLSADGASNITFSTGVISGTGALTKTGTGTVTLSGANTYSGGTAINAGVLALGSSGAIGSSGNVTFGGGTLQFSASNTTDYSSRIVNSTGAIAVDTNGQSVTFASALASTNTGGFTKSGTGALTLASANNFTGGLTLNTGTLNLNNAGALGSGTFTISGGTLDNTSAGAVTVSTNNAQAWNSDFTFTGTKDLNLGTGAVTLGASRNVTVAAGNLTVGGAISGSGLGLTKSGAGALVLTGASSTYSGATTVNAGTLSVSTLANGGANSSIGSSSNAAGNLVLNGGTLQYTGAAATTDRGFSVGTGGGTLDASGSGTLTLSNTGTIGFNGQTGARTLTLTGSGNASLAAVVADNSGATSLTKSGTDSFTITGVNTQTGTTTVSAGNLTVNSGAALSGSTAALVVNGGTLNLNNTAQTVSSLTGTGGTINLASAHTLTDTTTGSDTFAGAFGSSGTFTKSGSGSLTLSGNSSTYTGNINVTAGTLTAGSASALGGAGNLTVSSGATLAVSGGTTVTKSGPLSLTGTGAGGTNGALVVSGATGTTSQYNGNLALAGNTTLGAANNLLIVGEGSSFSNTISLGASTLTLNTTSAVDGSTPTPTYVPVPSYTLDKTQILINATISGTGGLTKTGPGTATLMPVHTGGSTFTGDTVITGGKLILDGLGNTPAINSTNVYIGNSSSPGAADSVILQMGQLASSPGANNMIGTWNASTDASATNLTVYSDGLLKMNGGSNGFASLTLTGGHIDGGGTSPLLTVTGGITTNASSQTAVIEGGHLGLGTSGSTTFTVASGTTASGIDLQVKDVVEQGAKFTAYTDSNTSVLKAGAGKMVFSGSNTYHGVTDVTAGTLNVQTSTGLGAIGASIGDTNNGTIVRSGAQLQLENAAGMTIGNETLTLNGTGLSNTGALRNVSGNNTYNGYIYLADATNNRINADSGTTLTIANTNGVNSSIMNGTAAGKNLTVGGAGNVTINGGIASSVNNVTYDGSGTLTLAGYNGYAGATSVTSGAVKVTHSNGLSGTGATVSSGAALQFAQDASSSNISVGGVGATINGTGLSNGGAIENLNGSNSYLGAITLGSAARINADSASTLTLSGGLSATNQALTIGGAGNVTESGNLSLGAAVSSAGALTKDGSGTFTFSGTTGTVGQTALNTGALTVNTGTLNTAELSTLSGTTLTIASGGQIVATYGASTNTSLAGTLAGGGTLKLLGGGNNAVVTFSSAQNAASLTLVVGGSTVGSTDLNTYFTLKFVANVTIGTLHITGDTILDFNNSASTILSSGSLIIDAGVKISVQNWTSLSDIWYATSSFTQNGGPSAVLDQYGAAPENQITFTGLAPAGATTWVTIQGGQYFDHEIRPTPEPSTYGALLLSGCLALLGWRRRRRA